MSNTDLVSRYDDAASWWQGMIERLGYRAAYQDLMTRALPGARAARVVDVGTGSGDLAAAYCQANGAPRRLTLIDSSAEMLAAARRGLGGLPGHVTAVHATLAEAAGGQTHDLVLCAHVIEHTPDPARSLAHLATLAAPGGRVLLLVSRPHWCQWFVWLKWRHTWFSPSQVKAMTAAAGLDHVDTFPLNSGPPSRTSFAYLLRRPDVAPHRARPVHEQ